jgi:glutaminyl-peptide cyclotransferase
MLSIRSGLVRDRTLAAGLILLPMAGLFVGSTRATWPGLFATSRVVEASATMVDPPAPPPIDGKRAYGYLQQICEIGPRTAGSAANTRQREMVKAHFKKMGGEIHEQPFRIQHPRTFKPLILNNLVGSWHPERMERIVIGAHYDTRPFQDQEDDPAKLEMPFLGANDGASGVALLMEMAHHLNDLKTPLGVDLVLFDGEELVWGNDQRVGEYFLGSKEFARVYKSRRRNNPHSPRYIAGIVLDMVGGRNLQLPQDPYSLDHASDLVRQVWTVARNLEARAFLTQLGPEVTDDHIPLNEAGIPTIDIIDFRYQYWHKADDRPENCSSESLEQVGRVVTTWLTVARAPAGPAPRRVSR